MKKIISFLEFIKIILKLDFLYKLPKKKIVVFDYEQKIHDKLLFKPLLNDCFFLDVRIYNLKYFYINLSIAFYNNKKYFKRKFKFWILSGRRIQ